MGHTLGHKSPKGAVAISNYKERIRLRWRYQGKRYSLNLSAYNKINLAAARRKALEIEYDIANNQFDVTLQKYGGQKTKNANEAVQQPTSIVEYFEKWVKEYKQMDCEVNSDYFYLRNTIRRWGDVGSDEVLGKLNAETFGPKTFNERLAMLKSFSNWMKQQGYWTVNPFEGVSKRKIKKTENPEREPFSEEEIKQILEAIKTDRFCPPSSRYKHSFYYPFIYFLFKTGVRPAEAVGLRVNCVNLNKNMIVIKEVLARSVKGTNAAVRVRKETKNGKVRMLPLTEDLKDVLLPMLSGKGEDDLVFTSVTGLPIDDRMFQRRIFSVVLQNLHIPHRVLYACRHTFGSRCIDQGLSPVMTAFLMGNNPETALRNYVHQISLPDKLPDIN
ncbi:MAG: site-specific integrase [Hydrotalea sp.]|nr:site-specific integrase [Hydrotalea sp.]